jgi:hypothetical protein
VVSLRDSLLPSVHFSTSVTLLKLLHSLHVPLIMLPSHFRNSMTTKTPSSATAHEATGRFQSLNAFRVWSPVSVNPEPRWSGPPMSRCYARRTRSSSESIRLQGRCSRRDATSLSYEVLGFLRSQGPLVFRGQDDRSWTMKHARLRRSKVRTRVQRQVLKYLTTRNRRTIKNIMESYE